MKLSELIKLPEKKKSEHLNCWEFDEDYCLKHGDIVSEDIHPLQAQGYNQALSDLANMEIEVDTNEIVNIIMRKRPLAGYFNMEAFRQWKKFSKMIAHAIASQLPKMIKRT